MKTTTRPIDPARRRWRHMEAAGDGGGLPVLDVAIGREVAGAVGHRKDEPMTALVLDFDHLRRARRLLPILVDRFGVAHFFGGRAAGGGRRPVDEDAIDDAVELAVAWIERRSGRDVDDEVVHRMRRDLERLVFARVKEGRGSLR